MDLWKVLFTRNLRNYGEGIKITKPKKGLGLNLLFDWVLIKEESSRLTNLQGDSLDIFIVSVIHF